MAGDALATAPAGGAIEAEGEANRSARIRPRSGLRADGRGQPSRGLPRGIASIGRASRTHEGRMTDHEEFLKATTGSMDLVLQHRATMSYQGAGSGARRRALEEVTAGRALHVHARRGTGVTK